MATNTDHVSNSRANYVAGAIRTAAVGATLPVNAYESLPNTWADWGFVCDSGFVRTIARNTTKLKDVNGDTILVVTDEHSLSFKFRPAQIEPEALKVTLGDENVDVVNDVVTGYRINSKDLTPRSYVFNLRLSSGKLMRIVVPKGSVDSIGDETMKPNEILSSELTIECLPDASGNKAYVYYASPSDGAVIEQYSIRALGMSFPGNIDGNAGTIAVTVPNGTTLTALVADFALNSGASAKVGSTTQVSGTTSNNFSSAVTYKVTGSDGSTKDYVVTVTAASV